MHRYFIILLIFALSLLAPLTAQETSSENLEDSLFGDADAPIIQSVEETNEESKKLLDERGLTAELKKRNLTFGGVLEAGLDTSFIWQNIGKVRKSAKSDASFLSTKLALDLYLDARPNDNLKIKGDVEIAYPFEKELFVAGQTSDEKAVTGAALGALNFRVKELYTDFSIKDRAFLRFGKCAAKWGTGYFYSPADVINVSRIDPEHPERDKEGPVHFRTHVIIPKTNYNFYAYFLPPLNPARIKDSAFAASAEGVFGGFELSLGGWWRYEKAPRLSITASGTLFKKLAVFAEGVYSYGSDYTYFDKKGIPYTKKNTSFFQATAGLSYSISKTHTFLAAQYYYNGFGYANYENYTAAQAKLNGNAAALSKFNAIGYAGQHYAALSITQSKIGTDRLSASLFEEFRITEMALRSVLRFGIKAHESVQFECGLSALTPLKQKKKSELALTLGVTLGGGKF